MKEIKTKAEDVKPKLMEHAAKAPKTAAKDLWLKFKEKSISEIKETPFAGQRGESSNAPANNAGDQMLSGAETTAREGASLTYRGGKKLAQATTRKIKEKMCIRDRCEWCGKETSALVMHQVRTLKELDESQPWAVFMKRINRKTLVVCESCHTKIHGAGCE